MTMMDRHGYGMLSYVRPTIVLTASAEGAPACSRFFFSKTIENGEKIIIIILCKLPYHYSLESTAD